MTPETKLVRAPGLVIKLGDADDVRIARGEEHFESTPHALAILHAFAQPRTIAEVLDEVAAKPEHFIEVSATIFQLAAARILRKPGLAEEQPRGFASPTMHVVMLDDQARTRGYLAAVRAVVRPGDVVVDIGTGTGVLATAAAQAGASRVYAIESSAIADAADRVFASNGVADRVVMLRGRSTVVALPERADVLVTETIGNDPLAERLLEITADAKARLLQPGARLVPAAIELFALPVDVPRRVLERHVFTVERLATWRALYGIDFSSLADVRRSPTQSISVRTEELLEWRRVAPPIPLAAIDLSGTFEVVLRATATFVLREAAERLGVALAFRATLAPGIELSTLADDVRETNHWRYALWLAEDATFAAGSAATIHYAYDRGVTSIEVLHGSR